MGPRGFGRRGGLRVGAPLGAGRRGSLCGGCASACLLIVIIVAVVAILFWREVNSAIRGVYPSWPLVLAVPVLFFAYALTDPMSTDGRYSRADATTRFTSLFRANLAIAVRGQTFRLYLFCHAMPERCFAIRGHTFPICARCTGLLIGIAAGLLLRTPLSVGSFAVIAVASVLMIPLFVDGLTQLVGVRESTNGLRLVTGVIGGVGLALGVQALRFVLMGF